METRKPPPLPTDETVWLAAFTADEISLCFAQDGKPLSPEGAAHLCAEFADRALAEFRARFRTGEIR
jgi:hypothetical protein